MPTERNSGVLASTYSPRHSLVAGLIVGAFLSTGIWATFTTAAEHLCVWLMLLVAGVWALCVSLGVLPEAPVERNVAWAAAAVALVGLASAILSGHALYAIVYDSYGFMPWVIWASALSVFLMASKLPFGRDVRRGLVAVLLLGLVPLALASSQLVVGRGPDESLTVFGNSNYFVSVMTMLIPIALGLARTSRSARNRVMWRLYSAAVAVVVLLSGTLVGLLIVPLTLLLTFSVDPALFWQVGRYSKALRVAAGTVVGLVVLGLLVASVPFLNAGRVNSDSVAALGLNVRTRADMWHGAQRMFFERPVLGYGPGGFKLKSISYIDPWDMGAVAPSEPLDVSPASPHSIVWTAATTFGVVGVVALCVLLALWLRTLARSEDSSGPARSLRMSLAAAFIGYAITLLTVPISPAQGLFPAAVAGLSIASSRREVVRRVSEHGAARAAFVAGGVIALALAASSMAAYLTFWSLDSEDAAGSLNHLERAKSLQPGDPLYRFRSYEYRLLTASSPQEAALARGQFMDETGVLMEYAPGLVGLAQLSMDEAARSGRTDLSWERQLLIEARAISGDFPNLLAEEIRVAGMSGDPVGLRSALEAARPYRSSYAPLDAYIRQAEQSLGTP